jgi:hypothetical protein
VPASAALDEFLAGHPPAIQALTRRLRALVRRTLPRAHESFYKHDVINYGYTAAARDQIVYLALLPGYVRLGFMRGTQLPDPEHLLVGEGRWLRHIKVWSLAEAEHPATRAAYARLIQAAWDYAAAHRASS